MNYIIFDLEWNQPYFNDIYFLRKAKMPIAGEIIQIGAVKVNEQLELLDTFNVIIKPQILTTMHKHVTSLTGISDEDISLGIPFSKAIKLFAKWCGTEPILLSWGSDDLVVLIDNMRLYQADNSFDFTWYDAQGIYSFETEAEYKQISLMKALLEKDLPQELEAHNALHDARYTVRLLREINLASGMKHFDKTMRSKSMPLIYPKSLFFAIYDGFKEKLRALKDYKVCHTQCPYCENELQISPIEHTTGSKYLSIAHCHEHGDFSILWRVQKYTGHKNKNLFFVTKNVCRTNEDIIKHYKSKAAINKEKEEKYQAYLQRRAEKYGAKALENTGKDVEE